MRASWAPAAAGTALTYVVLVAGEPVLERRFGLFVQISPPGSQELIVLAVIAAAALLLGILPAVRAYRNTLSDGLQMRV